MRVTRILNHVEKHKSFVYGQARWVGGPAQPDIEVEVRPRKNSRPLMS